MASTLEVPAALIVSGDRRIAAVLKDKGAVTIPAYSCRFDGFVNDTFTEYANASIYRTSSVRTARLVSTLQDTVYAAGRYYLGFTMYTAAGQSEGVHVWIGHREVAYAKLADPNNRLHLFVVPAPFRFRGGEPLRLVTDPTDGTYRIENVVLLPRRPKPTVDKFRVESPHVDIRLGEESHRACAHISWVTNRPATGTLRWGLGRRMRHQVALSEARVSHEATVENLRPQREYRYRIEMRDRAGKQSVVEDGAFRADRTRPSGRWVREVMPLLLRRPAPCPIPWPVSVGVPFPEGTVGAAENVRMLDAAGTRIPAQVRQLAEWPDGSVKWALLDFQTDGQQQAVLECGRAAKHDQRPPGLQVNDAGNRITVTTGHLNVEFPRDRLVLPGTVSLRQTNGTYRRLTPASPPPAVTVVDQAGEVYTARKPDSVVLEETGPERACIRIEARHRSGKGRTLFRSTFRVHLFRNSAAIRVVHTFENDRTDATFTSIRQMVLRADMNLGGPETLRLEKTAALTLRDQPVRLQQTHDNRYVVQSGGRVFGRGRRANGVADVVGQHAGVTLALRHFWQNYPKGLTIDSKGFTIEICPALQPGAYSRGDEVEDRLYYYLQDGVYKLKHGVSRTHEFWFHVRPASDAAPEGFGRCVDSPPLYSVSLADFNESRAVTQLPPKDKSPYPPYEAWVTGAHDAYPKDREKWRAYGMLNFGDWFGERFYNWGNQEYDAAWCFLQEYLRGGSPDFYDWAGEAALHLVDVDTCHHSPNPGDVGAQYAHCVGHVGGYYPDGYREKAIFGAHFTVSHTWVEGPFLLHLLRGDARMLDGALKVSQRLVGAMLNDYDFTNCRNCGWYLIHLSAAYWATGRRVFLNAARMIVERVLERQRPSGGWERLMVPGHCFCLPPRHTGNAGFMVGVLMVGLKRYYEVTGDRRVAEAIVRAADYCIDSMWVPEKSVFRYTSCPKSAPGGGADMRILKGIAFAWRYSGKDRFRRILLAGIKTAISPQPFRPHRGLGKSICSPMRGALQVLGDLPRSR